MRLRHGGSRFGVGRITVVLPIVAAACCMAASSAAGSEVIRTINVGEEPLDVSSDGANAWVTNVTEGSSDGTVSDISASTGEVIKTITVGEKPRGVSSDRTHVWVANNAENTVSEISASTGEVIKTIPVNGAFGVSSDAAHVWVTNPERGNEVFEIDPSKGEVINMFPAGIRGYELSSDGTDVWVANQSSEEVTELSASTGELIRTITVGETPDGISSDGIHVWVANNSNNTVSEIKASNGELIKTIKVGKSPARVSSDGIHVWVTNGGENTVSEIAASSGEVIETIPVGKSPVGVSSDGTHVWVANSGENTVSEIQIATPPSCATAVGHGVYKKVGQPGRLKLKDSLSTELAAPQTLNVKYESGKVHFRLLKLEKATCTGEPGERDFHGEGTAVKNKVAGYTLSFSIYEKGGGFFFESKLMKGAKEVEASGGPLKKSTEKIGAVILTSVSPEEACTHASVTLTGTGFGPVGTTLEAQWTAPEGGEASTQATTTVANTTATTEVPLLAAPQATTVGTVAIDHSNAVAFRYTGFFVCA
jgi:YVTN family beta-propeller protein